MTGKPTYEELEQRVKELEKEVVEQGRLEKRVRGLSLAVEQSSEGIAVVDLDGNLQYLNDAFANMHEYSAEELIGKNLSVFHTPQQMPSVEAANRQIKETGSFQGELWHVTRGGTIFPTQMHNSLIWDDADKPIGIMGTVRDISDMKQAEETLQKAHDQLESSVVERTEELQMRTHELDERVKELNCLYDISQLLEKPHLSLEKTLQGVVDLIPSSWQYPENTCARIVFNGHDLKTKNFKESSWKQSSDIKVYNDRVGTVEVFYIKEKQEMYEGPFTKQEKNLINAIAERLGNILVRFRAEEALIIRDKAIASSINGMAISDTEGNLTYINESALKMWGYDETEIFGKPIVDFWLRKKEAVKAMKTLIDKGTWTGELIAKRKDGSLFDAQVFARLITDDKGKNVCVVSSFIDVTKEKILQDELIRSERLAVSGGLAASIAHEINSPLQGIRSIISSIERTYKQDEGLSENLNLIKGGFTSIRDIVKRLLDLNRPGKEKKQPMDVNSVIEDTVSLISSHLKKNRVKVNSSLSSKVPMITASPQQLGQVFLNLINNSVEAMAGISNGREIIIKSNLSGKNIVIKVADTGPGIPKRAMKNIFDPFYTRRKKMGIGIGLSICHGIMEDHNGSIAVKNSPDGGAVFTITLPAR